MRRKRYSLPEAQFAGCVERGCFLARTGSDRRLFFPWALCLRVQEYVDGGKKYSKQRVLRWDECCSLRRGLYNAGLVCTEKPSTKLVPLIPRLTTGRQPLQMISQNQLNTTCGYPKEMKRSVIQRFQPCLCPCAPPTPAPQSWRRGGNTSDLSATTQPPRILLSSSPCVARTQPARHPSYTLNLFNLKI